MQLDLNLLRVFDALLATGSVTGAAERLDLSVPATSRALGRLRRGMGDPLLVRAGRGLVPTPFALRSAPRVRALLEGADALLSDDRESRPEALDRDFSIRVNDGLAATLVTGLVQRVGRDAPGVNLRFAPEGDQRPESLRDGSIDLEIGVLRPPAPTDLCSDVLYVEHVVGFVAGSSPLAGGGRPTAAELCAVPHVVTSRRGRRHGPLDDALAEVGQRRHVAVVVQSFVLAALVAAASETVALVPSRLARQLADPLGAAWFPMPVPLPELQVAQQWHQRLDADDAHRWLRTVVREATATQDTGPVVG
jgi:DNA-binding transcriptional LysR family regulator